MSTDSELRPICRERPADDPLVTLPLSQIRWIRDRLAQLRHDSPLSKQLWAQIASLYLELERQAASACTQNRKPSEQETIR